MSKPTSGPYVVRGNALRWEDNGVTREATAYTVYAGEEVFAVACHPENAQADAQFIATACNAYTALRAACEQSVAYMHEVSSDPDRYHAELMPTLYTALALAQPPAPSVPEEEASR
jgi:hypothetical protein